MIRPPPRTRIAGNAVQMQKKYHDQAYQCIQQALDLEHDKTRSNQEILKLYKQGLDLMHLALNLSFSATEWRQARELDEKMRRNVSMVAERIGVLSKEIDTQPEVVKSEKRREVPSQASSSSSKAKTFRFADLLGSTASPSTSSKSAVSTSTKPPKAAATKPSFSARTPISPEMVKKLTTTVDPKLIDIILNEILQTKPTTTWQDIAGLDAVQRQLRESAVLPLQRPDLYTGLRSPAKGILLFGPPGTGKSMCVKALAAECKCTVLAVSASTLMSKWVGESEKLVRGLFAVARMLAPSLIFVDEVDSVLSARKQEGEGEASRRLKTEFLLQFDGLGSDQGSEGGGGPRVIVIGATNRPQDLDEAVRRRFTKRILIPLPSQQTRLNLITHLLTKHPTTLTQKDIQTLAAQTEGYTCADLTAVCRESALRPLRDLSPDVFARIRPGDVRPISMADVLDALKVCRPSVGRSEVEASERWAREYGSE